jgi:hypothetical protein
MRLPGHRFRRADQLCRRVLLVRRRVPLRGRGAGLPLRLISAEPADCPIIRGMKKDNAPPTRKSQVDAVLLKLPGVVSKKIGGLDGYFVNDRMFACISGNGVGLRLPVAMARELQFSRENVTTFQPAGMPATREWIQIDRADAAEYEKDLELFQAALEFVKGGR